MLKFKNRFFLLFLILPLIFSIEAECTITADPIGFGIYVEPEDEVVSEFVLLNDGEEDVQYTTRYFGVRQQNEMRRGPRRDDPGDVLAELEIEHGGTLGLARDFENEIMWATHTIIDPNTGQPVEGVFTGYREANGELEVVDEVQPDVPALGGGYYDGVFYAAHWQNIYIVRYDMEGNNLGNVDIGGYLMSCTVDPEQEYLFCVIFGRPGEAPPSIDIIVLDMNNEFEPIGLVENLLDAENFQDFRGRIYWAPEHEDGHLWVSWRPDPNDENFFAWQVDIQVDEEGQWSWDEVQNFPVTTDTRSFGIGHDGQDLWIGSLNENIIRITDDGINEPNWLTVDPEDGVIPARDVAELEAFIVPGELEPGVYHTILQFNLDDENQPVFEMSVVMSLETVNRNIIGTVTDAGTGDVMADVQIDMSPYKITRFSAQNGEFEFNELPEGVYELNFTAEDYLPMTVEAEIIEGEQDVELEVQMLWSEFEADIEDIEVELPLEGEDEVEFSINNGGTGPVSFTSERSIEGGADVDPWVLREDHHFGADVDDPRLEGVVYADGQYFVSGQNGGDPAIYIFNREGEFVNSFAQPTETARGFRDLAYDGELIWGIDTDFVVGFTTDGEVGAQFESPYNPAVAIAWDPDREWLWIAATTNDILGIDREGNQHAEIDRQGVRIYGLGYWPDDPDGSPLYIHVNLDQVQTVFKCDPENPEMQMVVQPGPEQGGRPGGIFITNRYDVYSWVMMALNNTSGGDGGDRVDIWQLATRRDWFILEPTEGTIEADEALPFTLTLSSAALTPEVYRGFLNFTHDGRGGELVIPVILTIGDGPAAAERTLALNLGWNMVSVNLQPEPEDVVELMVPLVEEDLLLLLKDGQGRFYSPAFGFNNIPRWNAAEGYLMKLDEDAELTFEGMSIPADTPIPLSDGWQMIAYYPREPVDAIVALSGIEEQLIMAKDGAGRFYSVAFGFSNMGDMREGSGYLVKMDGEADLIYTVQEGQFAFDKKNPAKKTDSRLLPVHANTGENMSLLILFSVKAQAEIGVYSSGELAGSGFINDGACGLAVWGDDLTTEEIDGATLGDKLEIRVFTESRETIADLEWIHGDATYETDGFAVIELQLPTTAPDEFRLDQAYPNPFNSVTEITFHLRDPGKVSLSIFDLNGREISKLVNSNLSAGLHTTTWDAGDMSSGMYLVRLSAGGQERIGKLMLVR